MKRKSNIIIVILALVMCFTFGTIPVFASDLQVIDSLNTQVISDVILEISKADIAEYEFFSESLAEKLSNATRENYDSVIQEFFITNTNPIFDSVLKLVNDNYSNEAGLYLNIPTEFIGKYEKVYEINENTLLIVTPTYIVIDTLIVYENVDTIISGFAAVAAISSTSGESSKTYYGLLGNTLFSITVKCEFYYDGSSAWYKSGFDYYYTRGFLSLWQVSNWRGWHETSGTSYNAYCSGNFYLGIAYEGNGLIIQDFYCKNTVSCSKAGTISRSAIIS